MCLVSQRKSPSASLFCSPPPLNTSKRSSSPSCLYVKQTQSFQRHSESILSSCSSFGSKDCCSQIIIVLLIPPSCLRVMGKVSGLGNVGTKWLCYVGRTQFLYGKHKGEHWARTSWKRFFFTRQHAGRNQTIFPFYYVPSSWHSAWHKVATMVC